MAGGFAQTPGQLVAARAGLAVLGTAAHHRTGRLATPDALNDGYALGMTLGAVLLTAAVVIALTVLRRTRADPVAVTA